MAVSASRHGSALPSGRCGRGRRVGPICVSCPNYLSVSPLQRTVAFYNRFISLLFRQSARLSVFFVNNVFLLHTYNLFLKKSVSSFNLLIKEVVIAFAFFYKVVEFAFVSKAVLRFIKHAISRIVRFFGGRRGYTVYFFVNTCFIFENGMYNNDIYK